MTQLTGEEPTNLQRLERKITESEKKTIIYQALYIIANMEQFLKKGNDSESYVGYKYPPSVVLRKLTKYNNADGKEHNSTKKILSKLDEINDYNGIFFDISHIEYMLSDEKMKQSSYILIANLYLKYFDDIEKIYKKYKYNEVTSNRYINWEEIDKTLGKLHYKVYDNYIGNKQKDKTLLEKAKELFVGKKEYVPNKHKSFLNTNPTRKNE